MATDIAQEVDIFQVVQPLPIVHHDGVCRAVTKRQELREYLFDARHIGVDLGIVEQFALIVAKGWVTDPCGTAAHHNDGFSARLLQPPQHHDLDQAADMEGRRGTVKPDVSRNNAFRRGGVQCVKVGTLVNEAACLQFIQKLRCEAGHMSVFNPGWY